jgi:hypothetical protein
MSRCAYSIAGAMMAISMLSSKKRYGIAQAREPIYDNRSAVDKPW